ncbi:AraC family transcriptional regulator [Amycolatopsis pithecellobii]|uniref:Helix-turn-helix domain-containing protein n=1 Tax=Amycolatopsis pithecellobii TaxID=664692 RepID=A0A6N7Z9J8_9PSEU|nr:AraC family transcriptional regulator [Amycolatopsis pithecellobii]MTD58418.1 helix-turn-helix domain-containing protein [Amycolatopsis pithecellobii]
MLSELAELAIEVAGNPQRRKIVPGLTVYVERAPTFATPVVFDPVLYVVLQGAKQLLLDDRIVRYDESQLVIVTVNLPALAQVLRAAPENPYVAVEVRLDRHMLAELMRDIGVPPSPSTEAVSVHQAPAEIYDPLRRLLLLTRDPRAATLFASGTVREMAYHVLVSPHGGALRQMATSHSPLGQMAQATALMAQNLANPLEMSQLAGQLGISMTSLHRHFKSATGISPMTYYKRLRLHEARRLGAGGSFNVTEAAMAVGYASVAHFSRDYKRAFGQAPSHDFSLLRNQG